MKDKTYPVTFKLDCHNLTPPEIEELAEKLTAYLEVEILGGDMIFADGEVTKFDYDRLWELVDKYDVILD